MLPTMTGRWSGGGRVSFRSVLRILDLCENFTRGVVMPMGTRHLMVMKRTDEPKTTKSPEQSAGENRGPFDAIPVSALPDWDDVATAPGMRFALHAPLKFELACKIDAYLIIAPYARAILDISVDEGPVLRRTIPAGSGYIIPPGVTIRSQMVEPVEFLFVEAEPERVEAIFRKVAGDRSWAPVLIESFTDAGFAALMAEIRRSLLGDPLNEPAYLAALAESVFARLGCQYAGMALKAPSGKESLAPAVLKRTLQTVDERIAETLSVEGLARDAGLSRSHFSRAFQASTGESPQDFIIGRRVNKARELLANTDISLAEIATKIGFSSQAHFSTVFKKKMGLAPGKYRKAFRAQED
ncbi:MAG: AraC family transcriptional regulator [Pseudomonadota bacterium]